MTDPDLDETEVYFPSITDDDWATYQAEDLQWNLEALGELKVFLEATETRAFIILKNGRIVVEEYWNKGLLNQQFQASTNWYWASAAKSLTSFLIGQAVSQGKIDLEKPSSDYLGSGWSSLSPEEESRINVRHHLSMTTGLDDSIGFSCTDQECLSFKTNPGERWSYHNAPYTLLAEVLEGGSGQDFDDFFEENIKDQIGMDGFWQYVGYDHLFFSTARSMARFGLLMKNGGKWDQDVVIEDTNFLASSINSSQDINPSYGYLWWLNGKSSKIFPGSQITINQSMSQEAPQDMYAALGTNSQILNIVPSESLVLVRMGGDPDDSLVPTSYMEEVWRLLNKVLP